MTKEQIGLHDEYKEHVAKLVYKWRKMHFLSEKDRQRLLKFLSMMRMVCDSTYILDQKTRYDTKVTETMSILQSVFDNGDEKVVVFSQWERMTRLIAEELDKLGVGYVNLNGSVPSKERKAIIDNFTDDPDCRVFLSTEAGSTGLNLQAGSIMINLDLPWNPAVLEQRIARIYRLGQERNVQVINLVAKGTIEEGMLGKLRFKTAMFEGVLDNGEDTIFLGNESKFTAMMDTLGNIMDEEEKQPAVAVPVGFPDGVPASTVPAGFPDGVPASTAPAGFPDGASASTAPAGFPDGASASTAPVGFPDGASSSIAPVGFPDGASSSIAPVGFPDEDTANEPEPLKESASETTSAPSAPSSPHRSSPRSSRQLVEQGITFLSGLAETLQSQEATEQLVEALIETNTETGETHLRIPVPDKQTVSTLLSFVGKLFAKQ